MVMNTLIKGGCIRIYQIPGKYNIMRCPKKAEESVNEATADKEVS